MSTVRIQLSDDPLLEEIGWAAGRRGDLLAILVSTRQPVWRQGVSGLEALTDDEYAAAHLTLDPCEQARRAKVAASFPEMSMRRALIRYRTSVGMAGQWGPYFASLSIPEQRRRQPADGVWTVNVPALA